MINQATGEETSLERSLRVRESLIGSRIRLQDGDTWTIPSKPLFGPIADIINPLLDQIEANAGKVLAAQKRISELQQDSLSILAEHRRKEEDGRSTAKSLADSEADLAERLSALRAELSCIPSEIKPVEAQNMGLCFQAIGACMRQNYPGLTDESLAGLVSAGHIGPLMSIVRGERDLDDLFPEVSGGGGSDFR